MAVAAEIKKINSDIRIVYIGQRGGNLNDIVELDPNIDEIYLVSAGKLRRYHGEGPKQLLDFRMQLLNARDIFRTLAGLVESWKLMKKVQPSVVFTRGGYVSVPVAFAAYLRHIKYVTHDSDSIPSLANRLIAPKAALHLVALEPALYPYPKETIIRVGVPINSNYKPPTGQDIKVWGKELGIGDHRPVILITGGGNGAKKLNDLVLENVPYLLSKYPNALIVHLAGRGLADELSTCYNLVVDPKQRKQVIVKEFVSDLYKYSGVADVIIARGGATNLSEFAAQGKACIIIPSPQLGWNVRNTQLLAKEKAIIELDEAQAEQERRLALTVVDLLDNSLKRQQLQKKFAQFALPGAASKIAELIVKAANDGNWDA